jgi:fructuronate reductase
MTSLPRLSAATLGRLSPGIEVGTRPSGVGIVHLGIGAFHRAHQAVYTEEAMAADGLGRWGICGVTQRSRAVVDQLAPQDGLYAVLERGDGGVSARVIASVLEVISAAESPDHLLARLADPAVSVVTLTVTEKGYRRDASGKLDLADAAVRRDLDGSAPPVTAIGQLVHGLRRRAGTEAPLTVLSCDNLVGNGSVVRGLVEDFCAALPSDVGEPLQAWIERSVSFPSSMIDRIVPATTDDDRAEAERLLGVRDEGLVVAEPFRQWVIENAFAGQVPAWDKAGATITSDVAPYEKVKLRLLNATHSLLAYAGALAGYETIAEAVRDERLTSAAAALMAEDVVPTLDRPDGLDLQEYQRSVLHRFANPALRHRTTQVAMDGSQKLPVRLLGTIRDRLRAGAEPRWAALGVAAWMVYVARGHDANNRPLPLDDPLAHRIRSAADGPEPGLVDRLLGIEEIFDAELRDSATLRALLTDAVASLLATLP